MEWYEKAARLTEKNTQNIRYSETSFTKILTQYDTDKSNTLNASEIHKLLTKMLKRYNVEIKTEQSQEIFATISASETIKINDFAKIIVSARLKKSETYTRLLANMLKHAKQNPVYCIEKDPFSDANAKKPILNDYFCTNKPKLFVDGNKPHLLNQNSNLGGCYPFVGELQQRNNFGGEAEGVGLNSSNEKPSSPPSSAKSQTNPAERGEILARSTHQKTTNIPFLATVPLPKVINNIQATQPIIIIADNSPKKDELLPQVDVKKYTVSQDAQLKPVETNTTEQQERLKFTKKYAAEHPHAKFSGVVGLFASIYNPIQTAQNDPLAPNFSNSVLANNSTLTAMPLSNVQYVQTLADKTNMEDVKQFGDKAQKTTEAALAGSWRFHWGYENPLLLTPRRASIAQNLPIIRTKTDQFGISQRKYIGTFNIAAGLIPNDPLFTYTRDKIFPNTNSIGDCACIGDLESKYSMREELTNTDAVCIAPKEEIRKPNSTLLAFNADSGEFGITGLGGAYANEQWRFSTSISPKSLPKFKPSPWNQMPVPINNMFAGNMVTIYKPKDNILFGAQVSTFGKENRASFIGRTFWQNGTNAALALDYGTMPNRTKKAVLEPMGLARMSVEIPIGTSLDVAALGNVGRYYDSKTNFAGLQLNATYNPHFNFKYSTAFNLSAGWDSRYKTSISLGMMMNLK